MGGAREPEFLTERERVDVLPDSFQDLNNDEEQGIRHSRVFNDRRTETETGEAPFLLVGGFVPLTVTSHFDVTLVFLLFPCVGCWIKLFHRTAGLII